MCVRVCVCDVIKVAVQGHEVAGVDSKLGCFTRIWQFSLLINGVFCTQGACGASVIALRWRVPLLLRVRALRVAAQRTSQLGPSPSAPSFHHTSWCSGLAV